MKRYTRTRKKLDKSGVRVYTTTYYPQIPIEDSDTFIYTKDGDRFDTLAYKFYGDSTYWWIIAKANGIKGKVVLNIGDLIRIPSNVSKIIGKFKDLNRSV